MKQGILIFCLLLCLSPIHVYANDYVLGAGDVLAISVFGNTEMSIPPEIPVRPDGKISMPLVREVTASGVTAEELAVIITEKLKFYYEDPQVTVIVSKFRTTRIYVVGQVNRPGSYELDKSHNLLDALGAAQGWTQDALKTKVYIVRNGPKAEPLHVNLLDLLKKGDTSLNYSLNDGDIVYLSDNRRIDIVRDIVPLVNPVWLFRHWGGATSNP